ncbi:MAG: glycosyltransferase [Candidatus Promineifilaceae bacterium]|nr:glycosyltransferase [Candidatus Promineifilaceae bacterium]
MVETDKRRHYDTIEAMNVSVIATVMNEGEAIRPLLDSLIAQSRPPDEVVICDGGSSDDTVAILEGYRRWLPLKIIEAPGSNISAGRNRAIAAASGPAIAVTDAGVVLAPEWLAHLLRPLEETSAMVVSGWFEPDPFTDFEVVMGATVLPELRDVKPSTFLPSSRSVAFHKEAWQAVDGYPEWLDYGEDLIFDMALRERYGPFPLASRAVAYFRPRGSWRAFARQYFLYARGDGKANLWPKRHAIRYLTYLAGLPLLGKLIWRNHPLGWAGLLLGGGFYCRQPARRLWPQTQEWPPPARLRGLAQIPFIRLLGDLAKMVGYPVGVWWRWRRRLGRRQPGSTAVASEETNHENGLRPR